MKNLARVVTGLALLFVAAAAPAHAAPFAISNTGEGLTICGQTCPNYTISLCGSAALPTTRNQNPVYLCPGNCSHFIGNGNPNNGSPNQDYTTTFDLTGFNPATATLTGCLAADNDVTGICLNNHFTAFCNSSFTATKSFSLNSGFICGVNSITFDTTCSGPPGGFLADNLVGNAAPAGNGVNAPEPGVVWVLPSLIGIALWRRAIG